MLRNALDCRIGGVYVRIQSDVPMEYRLLEGFLSTPSHSNDIELCVRIESFLCERDVRMRAEKLSFAHKFDIGFALVLCDASCSTYVCLLSCKKESFSYKVPSEMVKKTLAHHLLMTRKGIMVHASAIFHKGKGYLFFGDSGSGKSTIARKAREAGGEVLNDDDVILRVVGDGIYMYSTPFLGEGMKCFDMSCRLFYAFVLKKSDTFIISRLKKKDLLPELFWNKVIMSVPGERTFFRHILSILDKISSFWQVSIPLQMGWSEFLWNWDQ